MEQRDMYLKSFFRRANERMETFLFDVRGANKKGAPLQLQHHVRLRRGSSVMPGNAFSSVKRTGMASNSAADIYNARKSYYSFVIACECLSEYAGTSPRLVRVHLLAACPLRHPPPLRRCGGGSPYRAQR
jgi:hypothetical protein